MDRNMTKKTKQKEVTVEETLVETEEDNKDNTAQNTEDVVEEFIIDNDFDQPTLFEGDDYRDEDKFDNILPTGEENKKDNDIFKILLVILAIAAICLGIFIYSGQNNTSSKTKVFGVVNGKKITLEDLNLKKASDVTAESVLDYARKEVIIAEMDKLKIPEVTNAELEKVKTNYIADATWDEVASQKQVSVNAVKEEVKFVIRINSYRNKFLNGADSKLVEPTAPTNEKDTAAVKAYNNAYQKYSTEMNKLNEKWSKELNRVFATARVEIYTLTVDTSTDQQQ